MKLSKEELERYARHIVLPQVGGAGQQKLKKSRVLVVGAGGLGSPVLQYLAAAGVGTLGLLDDDTVSLSNLQRQTIHKTSSIGLNKVDSAEESLLAINPHLKIEKWPFRLGEENALALVSQYDVVVDGCDNFSTRYILSDTCEESSVPLVSAAVGRFEGSITTLLPHEKNRQGEQNPSYRDLYPNPPPDGLVPSCEVAGILGAVTGIMGSLQAMETIKLITGIGECLIGRLLIVDAADMSFQEIKYKRRSSKD